MTDLEKWEISLLIQECQSLRNKIDELLLFINILPYLILVIIMIIFVMLI